jgi:hypothetical protein
VGKLIEDGWAREDDPIFSDSWTVFSVRKPKPQAITDAQEKPGEQLPESPEEPAP